MSTRRSFITFVLCSLMLSFTGCGSGDGLNRQAISGDVTFNGTPLEQGMIRFEPASNEVGVLAGTTIINGTYSIEQKAGLIPGEYRVRIFSPEKLQTKASAPDSFPGAESGSSLARERIPARYNTKTTLRETVTDDGENRINFTLVNGGK